MAAPPTAVEKLSPADLAEFREQQRKDALAKQQREADELQQRDAARIEARSQQWWPEVEVGDLVHHWKGSPDQKRPGEFVPAIVLRVNQDGFLMIVCIHKGAATLYAGSELHSVPHCRDPHLVDLPNLEKRGVWDLPEAESRRRYDVFALRQKYADLLRRFEDLELEFRATARKLPDPRDLGNLTPQQGG